MGFLLINVCIDNLRIGRTLVGWKTKIEKTQSMVWGLSSGDFEKTPWIDPSSLPNV